MVEDLKSSFKLKIRLAIWLYKSYEYCPMYADSCRQNCLHK